MAFEVLSDVGVLFDGILEGCITLVADHFLYAVMFFTPPSVVNGIVVVARFGDSYFEEVGIDQHGGGAHEPSSAVTEDADTIDINKGITICQLFGSGLFIG